MRQEAHQLGTTERDQSGVEGKASEDVSRANMSAPEDCWLPIGCFEGGKGQQPRSFGGLTQAEGGNLVRGRMSR